MNEYRGMIHNGKEWITYAEAVNTCHTVPREEQWELLASLLEACRDGETEAEEPFKKLLDMLM